MAELGYTVGRDTPWRALGYTEAWICIDMVRIYSWPRYVMACIMTHGGLDTSWQN